MAVRETSDVGLNDPGRLQLLAQALSFIPHMLGASIAWGGLLGHGSRFQAGLPVLVRSRWPRGENEAHRRFRFPTDDLSGDVAVPEEWAEAGVTEICEAGELAATRPFGEAMLEAGVRPVAAICARSSRSSGILVCVALGPGQEPLGAAQWQSLTMMYPYFEALWSLEQEMSARGTARLEAHITPRESEVARLVSGGLSNAQIGARLGIAEGTVKAHLNHIFEKLGIRSRTELAVLLAARPGPGLNS